MAKLMKWSRAWRGMQGRLAMVKRLIFVCVLLALDIRDLYYKTVWQGPADSFAFVTGSTELMETKPLVSLVTDQMRENGLADSGWPSFLSRCDVLHPFTDEGSTFFLTASARNCTMPMLNGTTSTLPHLIMVSSARVDSIAWAACSHLYHARRPQICGDEMVAEFNKYYGFEAATVEPTMMAAPDSNAEAELLRLLELIGLSFPFHKMVCVEAFVVDENERGIFTPHIYGCASPNLFRAEFVGFDAKGFGLLQRKKVWLTNDVLSILGWRFGIRQNCKASYKVLDVTLRDKTESLSVRAITVTNFSSFGLLYGLVVVIDVILLFTHTRNIIELTKWMWLADYHELQLWIAKLDDPTTDTIPPMPSFPGHHAHTQTPTTTTTDPPQLDDTQLYAIFFRSFYRQPLYRVMLLTTRLLSWLIIMPNSVIWTWSDSTNMKVMAYLCSIKSWVLVSAAFSWIWAVIVKLNERVAYQISRRTHITSQEIITISSLAALVQSRDIFAICEQKWQLENQRTNDLTSFQGGYLAHGNAFQPTHHHESTTPFQVAWIIYWPLVRIVAVSIAMIAAWLGVKAIVYAVKDTVRGRKTATTKQTYARLPLEKVLNSPIRALSIIRYQLSMECVKHGQMFIRPSCYLDYGIMLKTTPFRKHAHVADIFARHTEAANAAKRE